MVIARPRRLETLDAVTMPEPLPEATTELDAGGRTARVQRDRASARLVHGTVCVRPLPGFHVDCISKLPHAIEGVSDAP